LVEHLPFGEWLRKQRRAMDLSRQQLADQAGCAEITLRRIEGGTLKPSKELAAILLEKVGIPMDELDLWVKFARGLSGVPSQETQTAEKQIKTNLPSALTSFIEREKELADISGLLSKHRLVTLVGAGGVGKTRLSIKVGESQKMNFSDGVWMVELAPLDKPKLIPQSIASILGIPISTPQPVIETIVNFLRAKTALFIFDNCEHLLDDVAQLSDNLLRQCPHVKILATSRESMGVMGEATYIVPTMALPDAKQILDTFRDFGSMRLFEERAQLAKFDFSLTMENASFVAQICHLLDGIPLALELAAVQVGQFSPAEIAKQLSNSFDILTGGSRTALPRQQTIRASIDWSWNLLTDDEHLLIQRLSVFAGGWTLDAAQAVCGGDVLTLTNSLVKKSLIMAYQESGSERRFHFHEVIRQYAHEKLVEADEDIVHQINHLNYFVLLAERGDKELHSVDQNLWIEQLTNELPNLRAALEFAFEHDFNNAVRLSGSLGWFWYRKGLLAEARGWYEKVLDGRRVNLSNIENEVKAFYGVGLVAHFQADYGFARKMLEQSLALARKQENPNGIAHAHAMLGVGYAWQGDFAKTEQHTLESIDIFKSSGDKWGHAFALNTLGFTLRLRGDFERAGSILEDSVSRAREAGDRYIMSFPLSNLGIMAYHQGDLARGKELLEESLAIGQEANDPTVTEWCLAELGQIARLQGDFERAKELFEAALDESRTMGLVTGVATNSRALGDVSAKMGEYQKARSLIQESLRLFQSQGDIRSLIDCLKSFAELAGATSNWSLTVKLLSVVNAQMREMGMSMSPVDQAAFENLIDEARQVMSKSDFDKLWNEGEKLSMPDATDLALSELA